MRTLYNITAKRSGARMVVEGLDWRKYQEEAPVKISNVNTISVDKDGFFCVVDGGEVIRLSHRRI